SPLFFFCYVFTILLLPRSLRSTLFPYTTLFRSQDYYLNQLRKEHIVVTVFLTNGFQLRGMLKGFDNFTILLETEGKQQLIYKHAISTLSPSKNVDLEPKENN